MRAPEDGAIMERLPAFGFVGAVLIIVVHTVKPVLHATDELIFRGALVNMHRGASYYPAMRASLAAQDATASQVRSFRLPTEFLFLRMFPVSSYRWLAAGVAVASVALCWRLAKDAPPVMQMVIVLASGFWLAKMLEAVYLYAEIWALPFFLLALLAVRDDRWTEAAIVLVAAVLIRELYLPALVFALLLAPKGRRLPFVGALALVLAAGATHYALASDQLVANGQEAAFDGMANLATSLRSIVTPTQQPAITLLVGAMTLLGVVGVGRSWRHDAAARLLACTALRLLIAATIVGGRIYWPLMFSPALVAFAGCAFGRDGRAALDRPGQDSTTTVPVMESCTLQ